MALQNKKLALGYRPDTIIPLLATPSAAVRLRGLNPRRNLPAIVSRKRGESNFLRAFERAFLSARNRDSLIWQDFALAGYGIADLIWIGLASGGDMTALSVQQIRRSLSRRQLVAFELKLNSWRVALMQAHRYRYFADRSTVVLSVSEAARAQRALPIFVSLGVSLWSFDADSKAIHRIYNAPVSKPKSAAARAKAIDRILATAKLGKPFE